MMRSRWSIRSTKYSPPGWLHTVGLALLVSLGAGLPTGQADDKAEPTEVKPVSFHRDIRPLLRRHCVGCHQPSKKGGGIDVTTHQSLMLGGRHGKAVVPKNVEKSYLIQSLWGDGASFMPKGEDQLPEKQIALFERWIKEGATNDSPPRAEDTISADRPPVYEGRPLITAMAFSPDGEYLAIGGYREVLIHQADGKKLVSRLVGQSQRIESLAFSPDGKTLAAVGGSPGRFGEIQLWDVENKKLKLSTFITNDTVFGASWSMDGKSLAVGAADNSTRVIDTKTGDETLKFEHHTDWVLGTAFSIDGKHMVTVSRDRAVKLTLTETGSFIDNITSIKPGALTGGLEALSRHPSQDQVVVGGIDGALKTYRIFRVKRRQRIDDDSNLLRTFPSAPGKISSVTYNHDGSLIGVATLGQARIYDEKTGKLLSSIPFKSGVYAITFHPQGKIVAAGGYEGVVRLADAHTGKVLHEFVPVPLKDDQLATVRKQADFWTNVTTLGGSAQ